MKKRREDGWTFMETIIVIAIVLILTTTVGFTAIKNIGKARVVSAKTQIDSFVIALESFYIDCGKYPTQEQGLEALVVKPSDDFLSSKWNGPYLYKDIPMDPWGNPYIITITEGTISGKQTRNMKTAVFFSCMWTGS